MSRRINGRSDFVLCLALAHEAARLLVKHRRDPVRRQWARLSLADQIEGIGGAP